MRIERSVAQAALEGHPEPGAGAGVWTPADPPRRPGGELSKKEWLESYVNNESKSTIARPVSGRLRPDWPGGQFDPLFT